MAFVIPKAQKKSPFEEQSLNPGPGTYEKLKGAFDHTNEFSAPFNTSVVKVSTFDVPETNYGPGSYNSVYYKDLNRSSVVKADHVFASRVQRFKTQADTSKQQSEPKSRMQTTFCSLSPHRNLNQQKRQAYASKLEKTKEVMNEIRQHNSKNKVESIKGKRQFVRVILTNTSNSENLESRYLDRNYSSKGIAPGDYQKLDTKKKAKSVSKWENDRVKRFGSDHSLAPGPGAYYEENEDKKRPRRREKATSAFASTQIRSHMDTIIYKTNIPIKAAILQDKRIKDSEPGPGSYNYAYWNKGKKSFNYGAQTNFGTSDRAGTALNGQLNPGPGTYNSKTIDKINTKNQTIKQIRHQIFDKHKEARGVQKESRKNLNGMDPNLTYGNFDRKNRKQKDKISSLEQRCYSKLGNMNQEERFKFKHQVPQPGPGAYNQDYSALKRGHSAVFNSNTIRDVFEGKPESTPFYNVIRNDIGFKAEKMKRYIENLRKINIVKSPFQTSSKRFIEHKDQQIILDNHKEKQENLHMQRSQIVRSKTPVQNSAFKSATKRNVFKEEERPGPGAYDSKTNNKGNYQQIQKRSFNKNYNYVVAGQKKNSIKNERSITNFQ